MQTHGNIRAFMQDAHDPYFPTLKFTKKYIVVFIFGEICLQFQIGWYDETIW